MQSSNHNSNTENSVTLPVDPRIKAFEDLAGQVAGDIRSRIEALDNDSNQSITHAQLAQKLGVTRSSVTRILNAPSNLTLRTIADISEATNSVCHFRMTPNPSALARQIGSVSYITATVAGGGSNKSTGLSFSQMMAEARKYVEEVIKSSGFQDRFDDGVLRVRPLNQSDTNWNPPYNHNEDSIERDYDRSERDEKRDASICISLRGDVYLFIVPELTFADGFSQTVWSLYDYDCNLQFRSLDLNQVARTAGVIISRGGIKI